MAIQRLKPRLGTVASTILTITPGSWRTPDHNSSSTKRGYGYRWQKARDGYLRKHPLCCYCEREGRVTAATVVDHIVAHQGDDRLFWDSTNWQPLCKPHHDGAKQREERGTEGQTPGGVGQAKSWTVV